jgi:hypothetical protein
MSLPGCSFVQVKISTYKISKLCSKTLVWRVCVGVKIILEVIAAIPVLKLYRWTYTFFLIR